MSLSDVVSPVMFAALGFAAGLAYFRALWGNLRLYFEGRKAAAAVLALRLAAAAGLFWLIAGFGAAALLAALAGFLASRVFVLAWVRRQEC